MESDWEAGRRGGRGRLLFDLLDGGGKKLDLLQVDAA